MKIIYQTAHDGVIGVIESPDDIDPDRPLAEQLTIKIGVDPQSPRISPDEFEPLARLVVLELTDYIETHYPDMAVGTNEDSASQQA